MKFRDDYWFLSNMFVSPIEYKGIKYLCVEGAFQAQKCPERASEFTHLRGFEAKKLGKTVKLRKDWGDVRVPIMLELLEIKFSKPELQKKLIATGDLELIEDNEWRDTFWGKCHGKGRNMLGRLLMVVRDELQAIPNPQKPL